jgi:hypothetical protein
VKAAIVCGPRDGTGREEVARALDLARATLTIPRFGYITVGSNRGTDHEAWLWAMERELPALTCPARWKTGRYKGPREGPERNRAMYAWVKPVVVLGFSGGTGTAGMMEIACAGGTPAWWWSPADQAWILDERCAC